MAMVASISHGNLVTEMCARGVSRSMSVATSAPGGDALQAAAGAILTKGDAASQLMDADRELITNYVRCEHMDTTICGRTKAVMALSAGLFVHALHRALQSHIQQLEKGNLQADNAASHLRGKLSNEQANHKDTFEYLHAEIHRKNDEITYLKEQVRKLVEDQEQLTQDHERTMQVGVKRQNSQEA